MTTISTDLSSSLSGALNTLLESLKDAAPVAVWSLTGEGSEWYYEVNKRTMVKVPNGTEVVPLKKYKPDNKGRIMVQTVDNEIIRVDPERIVKISYH